MLPGRSGGLGSRCGQPLHQRRSRSSDDGIQQKSPRPNWPKSNTGLPPLMLKGSPAKPRSRRDRENQGIVVMYINFQFRQLWSFHARNLPNLEFSRLCQSKLVNSTPPEEDPDIAKIPQARLPKGFFGGSVLPLDGNRSLPPHPRPSTDEM